MVNGYGCLLNNRDIDLTAHRLLLARPILIVVRCGKVHTCTNHIFGCSSRITTRLL